MLNYYSNPLDSFEIFNAGLNSGHCAVKSERPIPEYRWSDLIRECDIDDWELGLADLSSTSPDRLAQYWSDALRLADDADKALSAAHQKVNAFRISVTERLNAARLNGGRVS